MSLNQEIIKTVLIDNIARIRQISYVERAFRVEKSMPVIFVGIRRSGKSYLMYQIMNQLVAAGHSWDEMLYINFEDERLVGFERTDFNTLLEAHYALFQVEPILFLDEIQNIEGWEKFARRVADEKRTVYLTGSNSGMLSREMASILGGRYMIVHVSPYSFTEFLLAKNIAYSEKLFYSTKGKAQLSHEFNEYFFAGGFPELTGIEMKRDYLSSIYQKIYLGDILIRNQLTNAAALEYLIKKIAETVGQPVSSFRLSNSLKSAGIAVGTSTVINYIRYARESSLLFQLSNYAAKSAEKSSTPKYYFADNGLLNLFLIDGRTALLENLVAVTLIRQYGEEEVFFYKKNTELDFFVPRASLAVQVSYSIEDEQTRKREVDGIIKTADFLKAQHRKIITFAEDQDLVINDSPVQVISIMKWLLSLS